MKVKMKIPLRAKKDNSLFAYETPLTQISSFGPDNSQVKKCQMWRI